VSIYTGLRISDVCTFRSDRLLNTGECHIRTTKTGRKVYTWLPEWLRDRIQARVETAWASHLQQPQHDQSKRHYGHLAPQAE
jgi:hypothetical protein